MIKIRKADERGSSKTDWLNSKHTFSFAEYYDPENMGFGPLRVINDDVVASSGGLVLTPTTTWKYSALCCQASLSTKTVWAILPF